MTELKSWNVLEIE